MYFFEGKGTRQLEQLLAEAANGVTPAIQGLKICSGVITPGILGGVFNPRILGGVFTHRILGGGIYPQDSRGGIYPQDSRGGVNNPNNLPYIRHWLQITAVHTKRLVEGVTGCICLSHIYYLCLKFKQEELQGLKVAPNISYKLDLCVSFYFVCSPSFYFPIAIINIVNYKLGNRTFSMKINPFSNQTFITVNLKKVIFWDILTVAKLLTFRTMFKRIPGLQN